MSKKLFILIFIAFSFSSCVSHLKNSNPEIEKNAVQSKFQDQVLKIYFENKSESDLQNVVLFRELILSKSMFKEVLLVQSQKIESCTGRCILFENKKSELSLFEKANMGVSWLTLGILPTRFTNSYSLKNRYNQSEDIEIVYWGSTFLVFFINNKSFQKSENAQLAKLSQLLEKADIYTETIAE